eukprot:6874879-Alexandrium_andersonii.AAC.1
MVFRPAEVPGTAIRTGGRMSNAPAGRTPKLRLRAAAVVTRGGENTSATVARTSPGVAPAAKSARA